MEETIEQFRERIKNHPHQLGMAWLNIVEEPFLKVSSNHHIFYFPHKAQTDIFTRDIYAFHLNWKENTGVDRTLDESVAFCADEALKKVNKTIEEVANKWDNVLEQRLKQMDSIIKLMEIFYENQRIQSNMIFEVLKRAKRGSLFSLTPAGKKYLQDRMKDYEIKIQK